MNSKSSSMNNNTFAAIDLGSNSFHMVIARLENNELMVVDRLKEMVRLAEGLDDHGMLTDEKISAALEALSRFGERLRTIPNANIRIVGTNTLRKAKNSAGFLQEASDALDHEVEIVSGTEEARLIYLGVAHNLDSGDRQRLVMDIGGGSTEIIIGKAFKAKHRESKYMGCVSFTKRFFPEGRITEEHFDAAELAAQQELRASVSKFTKRGWVDVIGASGTIKSTQDIIDAQGWGKHEITMSGLLSIRSNLIFSETIKNISLEGLSIERSPVYCGGLAILIAAFKSLKIERMIVSEGAMREGILHDLVGRMDDRDIRENTIESLMQRYKVDRDQAFLVETTALNLFKQLGVSWQLQEKRFKKLLVWSARIHEIGLAIAHSNFHKHGSYLLENSDLPGFSRQEQKIFWAVVRSHRRRIKRHRFVDLSSGFDIVALRIAVILRIAALLNRTREDVVIEVNATSDPSHLKLQFTEGFLDENPLTQADLEAEKTYLEEINIQLSFS